MLHFEKVACKTYIYFPMQAENNWKFLFLDVGFTFYMSKNKLLDEFRCM
ncbi:hypothetical protein SAMN05443246_1282 [Paenibacillus sp. GP183]|jgi:hypothetical protein|nr:hypothetical protein SAMN05443246_1282 [Paenibacillus sp. GP183]